MSVSSGLTTTGGARGRRVLVAAALGALLAASGLADAQELGGRRPPTRPSASPGKPGSGVKATWTIGGTEHGITEDAFQKTFDMLNKLEGSAQRSIPQERVWEYLLVSSEAEAYGIEVTEAELDAKLHKDEPDIYDGVVKRWEALGLTAADGVAYTLASARIEKLKDLFLNSSRVTTREAFDHFKRAHLQYKLDYLQFSATDYKRQILDEGLDDAKLKAYWSENQSVPAMFRTQSTVSAEFVFLDPAAFSVDQASSAAGGEAVSREEALDYFNKNRAVLVRQIPPGKKHLLTIADDTKLEDIVTPFQILEDTIRKTLMLGRVLDEAFAAAKAAGDGADLRAIAKKYDLGYDRQDDVDRASSISRLRRYGFNAFTTLYSLEPGQLSSGIQVENQVRFFFRLNGKVASRVPDFEEVKDRVRDTYLQMQASDRARGDAQKIIQSLTEQVMEEVKPLQTRLEAEAQKAAEERIQSLGLTSPAEKNREFARSRAEVRRKIEEEKKKRLPAYFEKYVAEAKPEVHSTDYFEFKMSRMNRSRVPDPGESEQTFLQTNYYIRSLQPGQVTPILLEDHATKTYYIARLVDRRDPEISTMTPLDLHQARAQLTQIREMEFMRRWRFHSLRQRLGLVTK